MKLNKIKTIIFALFIFLLASDITYAGLGISPGGMIAPNLTRGSVYEQTFTLSRSQPKEDLYFKVSVEGPVQGWLTTDKGMEFVMPKGEQRFPIVVKVNVPEDAANGEYKGGIRLSSSSRSPNSSGGVGVGTALSAFIDTTLTVSGEQIFEYTVSMFKIETIEERSPLVVTMTIDNTGNVKARPTKVRVVLLDKFNEKELETYNFTEIESVEPFKRGYIPISIPTKLGIGQYWAKITAYQDETIVKEDDVVFEIVEKGSLPKTEIPKEITIQETQATSPAITPTMILIVFAILVATVFITRRLSLRKKE